MSASLTLSRQGRLLRARLNRPDKRNALNSELCLALVQAFSEAESDRAIGAILLEAEGAVFCAGMDLKEALQPGAGNRLEIHEQLFTIGTRLHKPIVAAVNGAALAGGTGLVANAHVVIAADDATFGLTEIRIGMWPFVVFRAVAAAVGERRAVELSLTGRVFGAADAFQFGLVHEVTTLAGLEDRALAVASALAEASPHAVRLGLHYVHKSRSLSFENSGALASQLRAEAFESADFREGVNAFLEKRKPEWPSI
jgi:enoyl-CoA hydratase/carnithine racemase